MTTHQIASCFGLERNSMDEEKDTGSDFGKGFVYCMILFAKHHDRARELLEKTGRNAAPGEEFFDRRRMAMELWINGAADHMFEFEVPPRYRGTEIETVANELRDFALSKRLPLTHADSFNENDFDFVFRSLEKLAMLIDQDLGVTPIEANHN